MSPKRGLAKILALAVATLAASVAAPQSLSSAGSGTDEPLARPAGAKLVWSDEFDRPVLPDPKILSFDTSRYRACWYNG